MKAGIGERGIKELEKNESKDLAGNLEKKLNQLHAELNLLGTTPADLPELLRLRGRLDELLSSALAHYDELNRKSEPQGLWDKVSRRKEISVALQDKNRVNTFLSLKNETTRKVEERVQRIESELMRGLDKELRLAIAHGESVIIAGIPDQIVVDFLKNNGLLSGSEIIKGEELKKISPDLLKKWKKLVITNISDVASAEVQEKLWALRSMSQNEKRNTIIVASTAGRDDVQNAINANYARSPYVNWLKHLYPNQ